LFVGVPSTLRESVSLDGLVTPMECIAPALPLKLATKGAI
jgi:hypothetical protein